jgi:twinkle protein
MKNASEIAALLRDRAEQVAKYFFPDGKMEGGNWRIGSLGGEKGQSLSICLTGEKKGIFSDFATGDSGDMLDLWCKYRRIGVISAVKEAVVWLGIGQNYPLLKSPKNHVKPNVQFNNVSGDYPACVSNYLTGHRKLSVQTLRDFKIMGKEGCIIFPYFHDNELLNIKYLGIERIDGKKQIRVEANCQPCLFGWQALNPKAREVTICEGEIDAMTLHQYGISALSVPFGGGGGAKQQWIDYEYERLQAFDKIYICMDNDKEGKDGAVEIINRLGRHRCFVVELPSKDANECLLNGVSKETIDHCFIQAKTIDPEELKFARDFSEEVYKKFYPAEESEIGYLLPWEKCRGKVLLRPGDLSVWVGINGHGKSQVMGQVMLNILKQGGRVCVASLELKIENLLMRLTRQAAGLSQPTKEYIDAIHQWYGENLLIFDLLGSAKAYRLLDVFKYARQRYGITTFVIDSFMKLDIAEDDYKAQKTFLEQLCDFKNEYDCHVHLITHPRKGIDEERIPGKLDVNGSGSITNLADNCFIVWRNKKKEKTISDIHRLGSSPSGDYLDQPDALIECVKQRNGEWEKRIGLFFDRNSFQFLDHFKQRPIEYVKYSNS